MKPCVKCGGVERYPTGRCKACANVAMGKQSVEWNTTDEIRFIKTMGTHIDSRLPRKVLLQGYLNASKKRTDWGDVEGWQAIEFAKFELEKLEGQV